MSSRVGIGRCRCRCKSRVGYQEIGGDGDDVVDRGHSE
jgi:hypothetical protein